MRVKIEDTCTACELCVDTCPEVFQMGTVIAAVIADHVTPEFEEAAQEAVDACPVATVFITQP